jgi:DNA modification methylase
MNKIGIVEEENNYLVRDDVTTPEDRSIDPRNKLNDLTSKEWIQETVSVWVQKGLGANHPDAQIERQHPAPFSFTDVSRLIRFFTKKNGIVLDPFVGVGSTLKACSLEGRHGIGFELNPRYAKLSQERLDKEINQLFASTLDQKILVGDARILVNQLEENSVDFLVTSPPYWKILHKEDHKARQERINHNLDTRYSDDEKDLGNIEEYDKFVKEVASILGACGRALKPKKYMAIIVSDFRDKSKFIMFHADLANALLDYALELKGLKVLFQRHKKIFPNIHHQFILILQNNKE